MILLSLAAPLAAAEYPERGDDIYSPTADAAVDIAAALEQAKVQGKHVLLDFGANWCVWCHSLHSLFNTEPAVSTALRRNYVMVMIDVNKRHGADRNTDSIRKYGDPTQHGLPVLVVLDATGRPLVTQETGALEDGGDGHSSAKVLDFLARWAPTG